jgi:hypothetical protein
MPFGSIVYLKVSYFSGVVHSRTHRVVIVLVPWYYAILDVDKMRTANQPLTTLSERNKLKANKGL